MAVLKQPNPELQPRLAGTNYEEATQRAPLLLRNERGLHRTIELAGEVTATLARCEHAVKGTGATFWRHLLSALYLYGAG